MQTSEMTSHLIGGEKIPSMGAEGIEVLNPATCPMAQRAWRELLVGTVKINTVFGGAPGGAAQPRKASGLGFGYGPEVTQTKVVHYAAPPRL